jgi:hypothetical protein
MANRGTPASKQLVLGDRSGLGQVHVDIEAFFELSFWLAEELEDLVGEWQRKMPRRLKRRGTGQSSRISNLHRPR